MAMAKRNRSAELSGPSKMAVMTTTSGRPFSWTLWVAVVAAVILGGIPFYYGKVIEFGTNGPFDGGMNVYTAQQVVNGGRIGIDVFPSASQATLLVNIIGVKLFGFSELGPKLIQMVMQLAALALMFYALRRIFGGLEAVIGVALAAFYLSCPPYVKFGNVKEQFMIAGMIIAACGIMLRYAGGGWGWVILAGAMAFNSFFFKQTGASIIIAILLFLVASPLLKYRTWKQTGLDLALMLAGAVVGALPLAIFNLGQHRLIPFLAEIPGMTWLVSSGSVVIGGGTYLSGSKEVSTFAAQYTAVMGYYTSFVVIIGLGLLAMGDRLIQGGRHVIVRLRRQAPAQEITPAQQVAWLLAIWWLCDMAFVWVSPRAYVEYFLPINGSGAMLAAYVIWRGRQQPMILAAALTVWLAVDLWIMGVAPASTFPYVAVRNFAEALGEGFYFRVAAVGSAWMVFFASRLIQRQAVGRRVCWVVFAVLGLALVGAYNTKNAAAFEEKVTDLAQMKKAGAVSGWEQLAQFIKKNSQPADGLYVWGWYPGIYVQAQRFSPATLPSYGDMHSDSPETVASTIQKTVSELKEHPPLYIVDAQKYHYPYYDHPNFDLWPRWRDRDRGSIELRHFFSPGASGLKYLSLEEYPPIADKLDQQVEALTFMLLTHPQHQGGPLDRHMAENLARMEKERHHAMRPLREFIMQHYQPLLSPNAPMLLFQRRK